MSTPHTQHIQFQAPSDVQQALAPSRFVSLAEATDVPKGRVRQVSAYVEEHWSPLYAKTDSTDLAVILLTSQQQLGWTVTQRASASTRARKYQSAEEFAEICQSAQIQASDEYLNGLLETVPGNDPVIFEGKVLRGEASYERNPDGSRGKMFHDGTIRGTMITRGRAEYRERTKGFAHIDAGFMREKAKAEAEMASRPTRNVKDSLEVRAGEVLPMRRIIANPRVDRKSAV